MADEPLVDILTREETGHPMELTVSLSCGHSYWVMGLLAAEYRKRDKVPCEKCLQGRWQGVH